MTTYSINTYKKWKLDERILDLYLMLPLDTDNLGKH